MTNNFTKILLTLSYPNAFAYQQFLQAKTTNVIKTFCNSKISVASGAGKYIFCWVVQRSICDRVSGFDCLKCQQLVSKCNGCCNYLFPQMKHFVDKMLILSIFAISAREFELSRTVSPAIMQNIF